MNATYKLGELVEFEDGDRGSNYPKQEEFSRNGYCVFLSTTNIPSNKFDFTELQFITEEKDSRLRKGKLKPKDFVLTTRGTVGNFAYYSENNLFTNVRINSGMVVLRSKSDKLYPKFLQYILSSPAFKSRVKAFSTGSAQPQLPIRDLTNIKITLPEYKQQEKIYSFILAYDDLIENNEKRIKILEEIAQSLYVEWFVKFRFPGHEKVKMIDSSIGKIPEGWEERKIGSLLSIVRRKPKIKKTDYLGFGLFPVVDQGEEDIAGFTDNPDAVYNEDLIVFGDHTRILKYCNFSFACGADGTQLLLTNDSLRMPQILFYNAILNSGLQNYHYARHFKFLKALKIPKPNSKVSQSFYKVASSQYELIQKLKEQNQNLTRMRDLLIPQLVTGKRELKN